MNRRLFLTALIGTPTVAALLAACGDDRVQPHDTSGTTEPPTTVPAGIGHPTGADEIVLRLGYEGGFVAPGTDFIRTPMLLISGGGRVLVPGAVVEIYPGPLLPTLTERSIDEAGIQGVLTAAKQAGLLAPPPDYALPDGIGIADAPDTVVVINAEGVTYTHRAYALGIDVGKSTPARDRLHAFVTLVGDLAKVAGAAHLGQEAPLAVSSYRFQARPADLSQFGEPKPTVVPWPADTGVVLKDSSLCAVLDAARAGTLFTSANQLTFFQEGVVVYQLAVTPVLPGDAPC